MKRRQLIRTAGLATLGLGVHGTRVLARARELTVTPVFTLRNPGCSCCGGWAAHMADHGFSVALHESPDLAAAKKRLGIPDGLTSCHTSVVEGYRVEGHVPAEFVRRLLEEKPDIAGVAVPGMPIGSPGMEGPDAKPYDVIAFGGSAAGERFVFGTAVPG